MPSSQSARQVVLEVDLNGATKCDPAFLSVELVLAPPPEWDDERVRREAAEHYGVPLGQVGVVEPAGECDFCGEPTDHVLGDDTPCCPTCFKDL